MALVNEHFLKLPGSYLFSDIAKKVNTFKITHPKRDIIRLGIGDVTRPLPKACIEAMHKAVEEMTSAETFRGYIMLRAAYIFHLQRYLSTTVPKAIRAISEISSGTITA